MIRYFRCSSRCRAICTPFRPVDCNPYGHLITGSAVVCSCLVSCHLSQPLIFSYLVFTTFLPSCWLSTSNPSASAHPRPLLPSLLPGGVTAATPDRGVDVVAGSLSTSRLFQGAAVCASRKHADPIRQGALEGHGQSHPSAPIPRAMNPASSAALTVLWYFWARRLATKYSCACRRSSLHKSTNVDRQA